jgi:adenine-specific DNA-methyltransferase
VKNQERRQLLFDLEPGDAAIEDPRGSIADDVRRSDPSFPARVTAYPEFRYMGSKHRLLPWIHSVLQKIEFQTAADPFVGSGCVSYLMKTMGKQVLASDFLNFPAVIAEATIANHRFRLHDSLIEDLTSPSSHTDFIARTFRGVFYTVEDLQFLDSISANIDEVRNPHLRAMALAALFRACLKKQPRGVFTVSGDLSHYDDGRRDLRVSLRDHFIEQAHIFNRLVFNNGRRNCARQADVFDLHPQGIDLVYLDPPYVPRSDDNCYIKRYHFIEGLSVYPAIGEGFTLWRTPKSKK